MTILFQLFKTAIDENRSCILISYPKRDRHTVLEERIETQAGIVMSKEEKY